MGPPAAEEPAAFVEFYEAYPKREKRKEALAAFLKLDAEDQLQALSRATAWFAARPDLAQSDRQRYIPMPASWLNAARWLDDTPSLYQPLSSSSNGKQPRSGHQSESLSDLGATVDQYFESKYGH